jgi:hypothetical protein
MKYKKQLLVMASFVTVVTLAQCIKDKIPHHDHDIDDPALIAEGKNIFRYDAFGDESFWSGLLHIDKAIAGAANGGFGQGVSPKAALAIGLKVDAEALPAEVVAGIQDGSISLDDPATTLALLKLNAVLGVKGSFNDAGQLTAVGITCASCHSTVDNSFAPGIGKRLDGWPNRDLDVGGVMSLTDNAQPIADLLHVNEATLRNVLAHWGPGKFNAVMMVDGKTMRPDKTVAANLIPAAFGLKDVKLTTYTGWGDISYWNAFVANLEMHGQGTFKDPRLNNPQKYPIAVENHFYDVENNPDLITSKLLPLRAYQHSLKAPKPPAGSFDVAAANRGKVLFYHKAKCDNCHSGKSYTDNSLRTGADIGIDDFEAKRSPTGKYRTTPLGGLFARENGGFYHDGRFATYLDVVNHYNNRFHLGLSSSEKKDLVEYLKSL